MIKASKQWNDLHSAALAKISDKWVRLRGFTDRPEVCRDLVEFGFIEVKTEKINNYNVCLYRIKGVKK